MKGKLSISISFFFFLEKNVFKIFLAQTLIVINVSLETYLWWSYILQEME